MIVYLEERKLTEWLTRLQKYLRSTHNVSVVLCNLQNPVTIVARKPGFLEHNAHVSPVAHSNNTVIKQRNFYVILYSNCPQTNSFCILQQKNVDLPEAWRGRKAVDGQRVLVIIINSDGRTTPLVRGGAQRVPFHITLDWMCSLIEPLPLLPPRTVFISCASVLNRLIIPKVMKLIYAAWIWIS